MTAMVKLLLRIFFLRFPWFEKLPSDRPPRGQGFRTRAEGGRFGPRSPKKNRGREAAGPKQLFLTFKKFLLLLSSCFRLSFF